MPSAAEVQQEHARQISDKERYIQRHLSKSDQDIIKNINTVTQRYKFMAAVAGAFIGLGIAFYPQTTLRAIRSRLRLLNFSDRTEHGINDLLLRPDLAAVTYPVMGYGGWTIGEWVAWKAGSIRSHYGLELQTLMRIDRTLGRFNVQEMRKQADFMEKHYRELSPSVNGTPSDEKILE